MPRNRYLSQPDTDFEPADSLTTEEARTQVDALTEALQEHDRLYYVEAAPRIDDAEYDALLSRLQELEAEYPDLRREDSPTQRVGAPPRESARKAAHTAPLLSLEGVLERNRVKSFCRELGESQRKNVFYLEPKLDGVSVELIYEEGVLNRALSRGDGEEGELITPNVRTVRSVPLRLKSNEAPGYLAVRGEIVLPRPAFATLNADGSEQEGGGKARAFANPRNAASGLIRNLDPQASAGAGLEMYCYDVLALGEDNGSTATDQALVDALKARDIRTQQALLQWLEALGFRVHPGNRTASDLEDIESYRDALSDARADMDVEIDGIVIKLNALAPRLELGTRSRSPRWALAWKFPPRNKQSRIQDIIVQVGRTGTLTPVALLDPVQIGGVSVSRATLHNANEVRDKDLRVGDEVKVERAGDVIPEVVERIPRPGRKRGPEFRMPDACPSCGGAVVREGVFHVCPNRTSCPAQLAASLEHYAAPEAMNIEGLGHKVAAALVSHRLVRDLADLYELDRSDLRQLPGVAEPSARKLRAAIDASLDAPLARFIYALGIRHCGSHVSSLLAHHYRDLSAIREADRSELESLEDIGPEIADSVCSFFEETHNANVIDRLLASGLHLKPPRGRSDKLKGLTIVFTGELESMTRDEAGREAERRGARVTSSVSGRTDYLVVGEGPGSKLEAAKDQDVKRINEQEFLQMLRT